MSPHVDKAAFVGRLITTARKSCPTPADCPAGLRGPCPRCHRADPEVRARMSEARKRALADPEVRARMSEASKRALADPEVRARMSEASKRAWSDPEVRARMSEARKRALADPEVRARMKASARGARGVEIPGWVPESLHDEYLDLAAEFGEEAAASTCRRLKRDMAA